MKDPELYQKYASTIEEYLNKGYAKCVDKDMGKEDQLLAGGDRFVGSDEWVWHLPHHPVLHPLKPDKVRVVFDY